MMKKNDQTIIRATWAWIFLWTLFRLIYSRHFLLVPDETNYWQWGRHLALGYYDQSPLIAWAIALSTSIFGNTAFAVRLPSVVSLTVVSIYLVLMARRWFGPRAGWHTAIISQGVLAFFVGGLLATSDGIQAAAWAATAYHVACGFEDDQWRHWLMAGIWFGLGMLGKYTMVIFLPSALLYGLLSKRHRRRLTGIKPWIGVAIGMAMFVPVIYWNATHHWASFRHVAYIGGANDHALGIHWNFFGDYIASQAALLSPVLFILVVMAWVVGFRRYGVDRWIYDYLFMTSLPMIAGFALLSFHSRVYGNWPMAGYLTAAVLMVARFAPGSRAFDSRRAIRRLWRWGVGIAYVMTAVVLIQVVWPVFPVPMALDRTSQEISGWDVLGQEAHALMAAMPRPDHTFYFGTKYQTASELAFYVPGQPQTLSINRWNRPNVYDAWFTDADRMGWDAIGVAASPPTGLKRLKQLFVHVDPPVKVTIFRPAVFGRIGGDHTPAKVFYLYRAYDFKGGLRWIPPNRHDVRESS